MLGALEESNLRKLVLIRPFNKIVREGHFFERYRPVGRKGGGR